MKLLVVVTPPSIYQGCSTRKTFWEEKFTGKKQDFLESVNMRNCDQNNFRKHKDIKGSDKCVTLNMYEILNISEKFYDMDKMETASSESKVKIDKLGIIQALLKSLNEISQNTNISTIIYSN